MHSITSQLTAVGGEKLYKKKRKDKKIKVCSVTFLKNMPFFEHASLHEKKYFVQFYREVFSWLRTLEVTETLLNVDIVGLIAKSLLCEHSQPSIVSRCTAEVEGQMHSEGSHLKLEVNF